MARSWSRRLKCDLLKAGREPDILFVAKEHLWRLSPERLVGPADLVVEFVSRWSATRDNREKRDEYEAAGVSEFWIFDARPGWRRARFLRLGEGGKFREIALDSAGRYRSAVSPGFWLDVNWLWQDPLPEPDELKPIILAGRQQHDRP